ncbi:hypothetical protein NDK43_06675 [Neobacillus pocheonensis]|uniref:Uncharacterized protein n=1 Tax=Neobacillus pocheonensis TaxID=363869 RepID=A0ABT0W7Z6_9BACI|nr:hypothetical protein [Neobacillus pocheonensis]
MEKTTILTIEQIKSMSEAQLLKRMANLQLQRYYWVEFNEAYEYYDGPFEDCLTELAFIELRVSPKLAEQAYRMANETLISREEVYEYGAWVPMSEWWRLTEDYELVSID